MHDNKSAAFSNVENKNSEVKWSVRGKVYECVRCGYNSDRKSNVARHFRRFHSVLEKYKICICKKKFTTKGEYYEHCNKIHRHMRHSWYINTLKYKFKKVKPKTIKIGFGDQNFKVRKCNKKRGLRCSARLQSLYSKKRTVKDEKCINSNDVSSMKKPVTDIEDSKENLTKIVDFKSNEIKKKIYPNIDVKSLKNLPELHRIIPLTHLPLKKRFGNFPKRKCLTDITNFNNNIASEKGHIGSLKTVSDNFNNNEVKIHNLNLAKIDEQQRAFISQIDFDELNAILNLKYLRG